MLPMVSRAATAASPRGAARAGAAARPRPVAASAAADAGGASAGAGAAAAAATAAAGAPHPHGRLSCEHFASCSGCMLQEALHAPPVLAEASAFFAARGIEAFAVQAGPAHGWRTRAKLAVRPGVGASCSEAAVRIGLYEEGSHRVVDLPRCAAHHPRLNDAVAEVRAGMGALRVAPYAEGGVSAPAPIDGGASAPPRRRRPGPKAAAPPPPTGELRYLQLALAPAPPPGWVEAAAGDAPSRARAASGRGASPSGREAPALSSSAASALSVQGVLVWNASSPDSPAAACGRALADWLWARGGPGPDGAAAGPTADGAGPGHGPPLWHSLWLNYNASPLNTILGPTWECVHGPEALWDWPAGPDGPAVCFAPASFAQANAGAYRSLLAALGRWVPAGARMLELYAGVGAIGLSLIAAGRGSHLRCLEVNPAAAAPFERSRAALPAPLRARVGPMLIASAGDSPLEWLRGADVLIVDPPRRGLDAPLLAALAAPPPAAGRSVPGAAPQSLQSRGPESSDFPHTMLYVSCGFRALQRETDVLAAGGWRLVHVEAFTFFPGTDSLETLAVFQR